ATGVTSMGGLPKKLEERYNLVVESEEGLSKHRRREQQTDSKTGLNNLLGLEEAAKQIDANPNELNRTAVMFGDINNFGAVNKPFGHDVGDAAIICTAEDARLASLAIPRGIRPRMARRVGEDSANSDEFVVLGDKEIMYDFWKTFSRNFGKSFVGLLEKDEELRRNIASFSHGVEKINGVEMGYVKLTGNEDETVIISLATGITDYKAEDTIADMIKRADGKMSAAKKPNKAELGERAMQEKADNDLSNVIELKQN
ncbi:MAG: diguanylate cyclase, partial [Patescibacteria group bacterium]